MSIDMIDTLACDECNVNLTPQDACHVEEKSLVLCEDCYDDFCDNDSFDYVDRSDEYDSLIDGVGFADPGGHSALRAETRDNPRNLPCGNCGSPNRLTPADKRAGYQCDSCADRAEGRGGY